MSPSIWRPSWAASEPTAPGQPIEGTCPIRLRATHTTYFHNGAIRRSQALLPLRAPKSASSPA
jgi:hypothetical protein